MPEDALAPQLEAPASTEALVAIARAYDEYAPVIFRVLRRFGVADSALDDAVQDVFLVACRRYAEFEGRSSTRTWLYGIARRVARDHRLRGRRGERETADTDALHAGRDPASITEAAEAARLLDRALEGMSEGVRDAYVLVELEELSAPEIAALLDVPLNTVYSRVRLARQHVQSFVRELGTQRRAT
ncbi:MAG TPA: sigma-70 family RNA polymerase sigma factor [Polyangiales bacterium]|nr:sigma-70 family RNA polymerase sigma factor [Polyangiales bacterium]